MNKISIIGAGWLGWPLGKTLVKEGYQVLGSTTREEKLEALRADGIQPFLLKISNEGIIGEATGELLKTDLLIINIPPGRRNLKIETDYPFQIKLLVQAAIKEGVRHFIFVSSTGIYGDVNGLVDELTVPLPTSNSGRALQVIEEWLWTLENIRLTILRSGGLVGGERKAGRFLAGKTELPNGQFIVNMVHREDVIRIIQSIISQQQWNLTLNCVADQHPTKSEFYVAQAKKQGFEPPTFLPIILNAPTGKIVSNESLKKILKYYFIHPDPMSF